MQDVKVASAKLWFTLNYNETKYITNEKDKIDNIIIGKNIVAQVEPYIYLGLQIIIGKVNQKQEINVTINKKLEPTSKI